MTLPASLDELEDQFKKAVTMYGQLKDSKKRQDKELAQYHLGVASGVYKTLHALGDDDWIERMFDELQDESDKDWHDSEGGKLMSGADRWMGRRVFHWGQGRPPYPGAG